MAQKRQREFRTSENKTTRSKGKEVKSILKNSASLTTPKTKEPETQDTSIKSDSDLDDEDEFNDVQDEDSDSSSEDDITKESERSDSASEVEDGEDDSFPLKKKKKTADDGRGTFANAFNAIIGSKLKAHDRKDPILVRNKSTLKKLESDKLEAKAKRALLVEKKELQDKFRVVNLLPSAVNSENAREIIEKERTLRKVAQKGVVKLFNAVLSTQVRTNIDVAQESAGQTKKEELINELSKSKFLNLVKAAGDD